MALTVNQAMLHAISHIKGPSTYASSEEVRFANSVQSIISGYHRWHWNITAATNIAVASTNQDLSMAAGNQNLVLAIQQANLLESSTEQPDLWVYSDPLLPKTSTTGQPFAISLLSPTQVRLYPAADATYTLQWRYYARPVIMTANTESFTIPEAFTDVCKAGMKWQVGVYADDDRAPKWEEEFFALLKNYRAIEMRTTGRNRV